MYELGRSGGGGATSVNCLAATLVPRCAAVRVSGGVMRCVSGTCVDVVQVGLMGVVSSAVAAMDAHRGVVAVAKDGLWFLRNLSCADGTKVCARWCSMDSGHGRWPVCWGKGRGLGMVCGMVGEPCA